MGNDVKYELVFRSEEYVKVNRAAEKVGMTVGEFIRTNVGLAVDEVLSDD